MTPETAKADAKELLDNMRMTMESAPFITIDAKGATLKIHSSAIQSWMASIEALASQSEDKLKALKNVRTQLSDLYWLIPDAHRQKISMAYDEIDALLTTKEKA